MTGYGADEDPNEDTRPCPRCGGKGKRGIGYPKRTCRRCGGNGRVAREEEAPA